MQGCFLERMFIDHCMRNHVCGLGLADETFVPFHVVSNVYKQAPEKKSPYKT